MSKERNREERRRFRSQLGTAAQPWLSVRHGLWS